MMRDTHLLDKDSYFARRKAKPHKYGLLSAFFAEQAVLRPFSLLRPDTAFHLPKIKIHQSDFLYFNVFQMKSQLELLNANILPVKLTKNKQMSLTKVKKYCNISRCFMNF